MFSLVFKSHLFIASLTVQVISAQHRRMFSFGKHHFLTFLLNIWVSVQTTALEPFLQLRNVADM